jgi:pyruvate dehydrogenase E2 component (dihydrolipoamide acetyltransferase)
MQKGEDMAKSFKLPDLGEGIHEGEVLSVHVSVGDEVQEGDTILEVETDKAAVEIPSPFTGTVKEILVKPGDLIKVGDVLMTFEDGAEKTAETPPKKREDRPIPASPATRRLARELGVDLHDVSPSGPEGLVTADDVRSFADKGEPEEAKEEKLKEREKPAETVPAAAPAPKLPDFEKWGPVERKTVRSVRRATAKQMALAWSQIPHVSSQDMVDLTKLEAFRQKHKDEVRDKGGKLTLTVFAMKAAVSALKAYPNFNASLDTEAGEIVLKRYYHIGVAVDTEEGLIVPVIRDVDRKSITELAIELSNLVKRTRERKATLEEMQGATFTITNVGAAGGGHFAPIINYPQVAILGMGAARMQPMVVERSGNRREIAPRLMLPLVLSIDHRVLDGADGMRFMQVVKKALEDTDQLLMTMI